MSDEQVEAVSDAERALARYWWSVSAYDVACICDKTFDTDGELYLHMVGLSEEETMEHVIDLFYNPSRKMRGTRPHRIIDCWAQIEKGLIEDKRLPGRSDYTGHPMKE